MCSASVYKQLLQFSWSTGENMLLVNSCKCRYLSAITYSLGDLCWFLTLNLYIMVYPSPLFGFSVRA